MSSSPRNDSQYTPNSEELLNSVTVLHPDHPLHGQKVEIVTDRYRVPDELIVRLPDGTHCALPQCWTDYQGKVDPDSQAIASHLLDIDGLRAATKFIQLLTQEESPSQDNATLKAKRLRV
ncbi:MAG: DUF5372 family protein [Pyrinomonadaceae bacterium]